MINYHTLEDIPNTSLLNMIKVAQSAVGVNVVDEQISFFKKDETTLFYKINGKSQGIITIQSKDSESIMLSAHDYKAYFKMFSGIEKSLYFYFDMNFEMIYKMAVVQEILKNSSINIKNDKTIQMVAVIYPNDSIKSLSFFQRDNNDSKTMTFEKSEYMSIEEENLLCLMYYYKFKHPETYKSMFDDIEGPSLISLSNDEIKQRLNILQAMEY